VDTELPLNDERKAPRKGSIAWTINEVRRFRQLSAKHGGLTSPHFCSVALGVSRQRVHQLMQGGRLPFVEILGRPYVACDHLEAFAAVDRLVGRPGWQTSESPQFA
jgi:hypothetical protein